MTADDFIRLAPDAGSDGIEPGARIGGGRRACVYAATCRGERAVIKRYTESQRRRCMKYLGKDAAQFEYERNARVYENERLRPFSARPLALVKTADGEGAFVQEYIDAPILADHLRTAGRLSAAIFEAGRAIVEELERSGLHDLDMPAKNIKLIDDERGMRPVLFDFNLLPQHLVAPNPVVWLAYKRGWRKPAHRDYRCVASWLRGGLLTP